MISSITNAASSQASSPVGPTATSKKAAGANQSSGAADTDTVQLSATAQAHLSAAKVALQEAAETPAQTAKEAAGGDVQARRLLAREAQAAKSR